jgi:hypothetical protein
MRRTAAALVLVAALVAGAAAQATSNPAAARHAARWIARELPSGGDGQAADAIVDLRATGLLTPAGARRRAAALRAGAKQYLTTDVTTSGPAGKLILGLTASGVGNPRCAGSIDLLAALRAGYKHGIFGVDAFDDAAALLALRALHEPIPPAAITALRAARHGGGWPLRITSAAAPDVVESTGIVIEALRAAGVSAHDPALRSALAWMRANRAQAGGFGAIGEDADADMTGIALTASNALGVADPRAVRALIALQRPSGAIQYEATDPGNLLFASLDGTLGLSGRVPPLGARRSAPPGC